MNAPDVIAEPGTRTSLTARRPPGAGAGLAEESQTDRASGQLKGVVAYG